ncbi:MAG: NAD-dependent epimerase/dehydratase family protein, partial [Planctomycetota bacterium]
MKTKHRVLVTGASGFLGSSVLEVLSKKPLEVIALGHSADTAREVHEQGNVTWKFADICDKDALRDTLKGCDTVIHLVGLLTECPKKGITHQRVVVEGSQCLAEACADSGVRKIIYVSAAGTNSQS